MKAIRNKISLDPLQINCKKTGCKADLTHAHRSMSISKQVKNTGFDRESISICVNNKNNRKGHENMNSHGKYSHKNNSKIKTVGMRIDIKKCHKRINSQRNSENQECLDRLKLLQIQPNLNIKPNHLKQINRKILDPTPSLHFKSKQQNLNKILVQNSRRRSTLESMKNPKVISGLAYREPHQMGQGLSHEALFMRKESHLNAHYNIRKNRLLNITKENKKIYVRINSQKSLYSSRDLNKSYQSNCSLSRRLSQSKISRNSLQSSRSKINGKVNTNCIQQNNLKKKEIIIFQSHDINYINSEEMKKYENIFNRKDKVVAKDKIQQKNEVQRNKRTRNSHSQRIREREIEEDHTNKITQDQFVNQNIIKPWIFDQKNIKEEYIQEEKQNTAIHKIKYEKRGLEKIIEENLNQKRSSLLRPSNKMC